MKKVILTGLNIRNFKGIKALDLVFSENTEILAKNGKGKTTIADAYYWLLYGKNSKGESVFEIKTIDKSTGKSIPKLEHEVEGFFDFNGNSVQLKKIYREKWVKKHGSDTEELTGHETNYFVNDVPVQASEYKSKVNEIIDENLVRLISGTTYFNEEINWKERRKLLLDLSGEISDETILSRMQLDGKEIEALQRLIDEKKDFNDEKKVISTKKKLLKSEIEQIPARTDELDRSKPEAKDWNFIESQIKTIEDKIESKREELNNVSKLIQNQKEEIYFFEKKKYDLESKLDKLVKEQSEEVSRKNLESQREQNSIKEQIQIFSSKYKSLENQKQTIDSEVQSISKINDNLREKFSAIQSKNFTLDPSETCCPTCKRELDNFDEITESLKANFNKWKIEETSKIESEGIRNKSRIEELKSQSHKIEEEIEQTKNAIRDLEAKFETISNQKAPALEVVITPEMESLKNEIESIIIPEIHKIDDSILLQDVRDLEQQKNDLSSQLVNRSQIEKIDARINELNISARELSQELANHEKTEMQIDNFNKYKSLTIEENVNSKFAFVRFKMFEEQINGGESETCICVVDGVPYSSLNDAMKVNSSLDIIKTFQNYYDLFVPVIIDGRESVTNIIPMNCQIISLIVDKNSEEITVVNA